jgi:hypothetical protein
VKHDRKKEAPLGAGQVLGVLPNMPFDPEPYIPCGRCSLLERWPRWWGVGNLFATAALGNDAQRKKQDRSTPTPHFLLTFGDASRPPVGAIILEAPSMHHARMTAVVRRLAPGVPFGEGLTLSAKMMSAG